LEGGGEVDFNPAGTSLGFGYHIIDLVYPNCLEFKRPTFLRFDVVTEGECIFFNVHVPNPVGSSPKIIPVIKKEDVKMKEKKSIFYKIV
jgi:hypothetical protein